MTEIAQLISTLGYPIAMSLIMLISCKYIYDKERKSLDATIDKIGALTMAVEHNAEAIRDLTKILNEKDEK